MSELEQLWKVRADLETLLVKSRPDGPGWVRSWRQRERWNSRWANKWNQTVAKLDREVDMERVVKTAQKALGRVSKAQEPPPPATAEEVAAAIAIDIAADQFEQGAMAAYIGLSEQVADDAGQFTLDALGLHKTFDWASRRDFPENPFEIRGSKIIQQHYGNHIAKLAAMVIRKCQPEAPRTIGQLTKEIQAEWSKLRRHEALRIARTESAYVWESTNWNAMALNGINEVQWLIATGPSIGKSVGPVCEECLKHASLSPYVMDDMQEIPPVHPNCRCTLIPLLTPTWLPPAEPWTGAERPLVTFA